MKIKLRYCLYRLKFNRPFTLSKGTRTGTDCVLISLSDDNHRSFGIAALPPYFKETQESVVRALRSIDLKQFDGELEIDTAITLATTMLKKCAPALAAFDVAIHDLIAKRKGQSLSELLGMDPYAPVDSAYTIGTDDPEKVEEIVKAADSFKMLKVKMGMEKQWEILSEVRRLSDKKIFVDVNQGWSSKEGSLNNIIALEKYDIDFVEEPFAAGDPGEYRWLKERSSIPLFADEQIWNVIDLEEWIGSIDGVNIKLMKAGGIAESIKMVKRAREEGMKIMMGCMAEGACSVSSAACIGMITDYRDLDGPSMVSNDPFTGLIYNNGLIEIPQGKGNGIQLNASIELKWLEL